MIPIVEPDNPAPLVAPASLQELLGAFPELHQYMPPSPVQDLPGYSRFSRPQLPQRLAERLTGVLRDLLLWRHDPRAREDADLIALLLMPLFDPFLDDITRMLPDDSRILGEQWRSQFAEVVSRLQTLASMLESDSRAVARSALSSPPVASRSASVSIAATLIVHGTAAANANWWREDPADPQNFWAFIDGLTGNSVRQGHEFTWSGGVTDVDRRQGANLLLNWWRSEGMPELSIIAHSHGANVVLQAMIFDAAFSPKSLVTLGMPACFIYPVTLDQVGHIHNVYSEHDLIQVPGAAFAGKRGEGRTLPESPKVGNHHAPYWSPLVWGQRAVGHSHLHEPQVWTNNHLDKLL